MRIKTGLVIADVPSMDPLLPFPVFGLPYLVKYVKAIPWNT